MNHLKKFNENDDASLDIHGLKCDNPSCDWNDMSIPFEDYPNHVDASCPECGENILKNDEYQELLQLKNAVDLMNTYTEEELRSMLSNLSPEDMDAALDQMNDLKKRFKLKKTDNGDGTETWGSEDNINESLPRQQTVDQLKKLRKLTKGTDIGDRISDLSKQGANIQYAQNPIDTGIESYEDFEKHNKKFVPSWNLKHLLSPFSGENKKKK